MFILPHSLEEPLLKLMLVFSSVSSRMKLHSRNL